MSDAPSGVELVVRTIAQTAVDNEKYFGDLDAVVGDGDFGYSLARGFEKVLEGWDGIDRSDVGTFLKKTGMIITSRIGGTSGPIWGTAFLRAGMTAGDATSSTGEQVVAMLRAAVEGIKARGQSDVGDKTLLDALVPLTDRLEQELAAGADAGRRRSRPRPPTAREAAEATQAHGRQAGPRVLHRRAQHGLGRRRRDGRRRDRRADQRGLDQTQGGPA